MNYLLIFGSGVLSLMHCYGMCGIFPTTVSSINKQNTLRVVLNLSLYNIGRVLSYIFLGFLVSFGAFKFNNLVNHVKYLSDSFSIALGILMGFIGIKLLTGKSIGSIGLLNPIYESIIYIINVLANNKSIYAAFLIGVFNGLLPCPMVYGFLLLSALSKSPIQGILIMLFFGLGTMVTMFSLGFLSKYFWKLKTSHIYKLIGIVLIYFSYESVARAFMSVYNCR